MISSLLDIPLQWSHSHRDFIWTTILEVLNVIIMHADRGHVKVMRAERQPFSSIFLLWIRVNNIEPDRFFFSLQSRNLSSVWTMEVAIRLHYIMQQQKKKTFSTMGTCNSNQISCGFGCVCNVNETNIGSNPSAQGLDYQIHSSQDNDCNVRTKFQVSLVLFVLSTVVFIFCLAFGRTLTLCPKFLSMALFYYLPLVTTYFLILMILSLEEGRKDYTRENPVDECDYGTELMIFFVSGAILLASLGVVMCCCCACCVLCPDPKTFCVYCDCCTNRVCKSHCCRPSSSDGELK